MDKDYNNIGFADFLRDYIEYHNLSYKEFAERIGITPKHLIDILNKKEDLSTNIIYNIAFITDISADYIFRVERSYKLRRKIMEYLETKQIDVNTFINKFNYKYLDNNKLVEFNILDDKYSIARDILKFLRVTDPKQIYNIDKGILYSNNNDKAEDLAIWLELCYRETLKQKVNSYDKTKLINIVKYIKDNLNNQFNSKEMLKILNNSGIYFVIMNKLDYIKTKGAFRVYKDKPAIYINSKDMNSRDIYMTILHELAHCKSDFNRAKAMSLIDGNNKDEIESKTIITVNNWLKEKK